MIKIENYEVMGWEHAIRGMRNPMNSWEKSDSERKYESWHDMSGGYIDIGPNDQKLMMTLRNAGTDHRKFMRMITVYADITAPLYWWKEFDTYKVGTVANSCSTMHKIADKEFTLEDFSCENLLGGLNHNDERDVPYLDFSPLRDESAVYSPRGILECCIIPMLNLCREAYLETKDKKYWWQMIQLLPSSYNQKRTVQLNYEVLANIYKSRRNHKLDEWSVDFCGWIEKLPYSELIIGKDEAVEIVTDCKGEEVCRFVEISGKSGKDEEYDTKYFVEQFKGLVDSDEYETEENLNLMNWTKRLYVRDGNTVFSDYAKGLIKKYFLKNNNIEIVFQSDKEEKDEVN